MNTKKERSGASPGNRDYKGGVSALIFWEEVPEKSKVVLLQNVDLADMPKLEDCHNQYINSEMSLTTERSLNWLYDLIEEKEDLCEVSSLYIENAGNLLIIRCGFLL